MHVIQIHAVQIHNVLVLATESQNVHAYRVILKVRIQFVDALNQRIHANQIHAVLVHRVMLQEIQFVIVPNRLSVIHLNNVVHQLLFVNCAIQDHAVVRIQLFIKAHKYVYDI